MGCGNGREGCFDGRGGHRYADMGHWAMGARNEVATALGWNREPWLEEYERQDCCHQGAMVEGDVGPSRFPLSILGLLPGPRIVVSVQ